MLLDAQSAWAVGFMARDLFESNQLLTPVGQAKAASVLRQRAGGSVAGNLLLQPLGGTGVVQGCGIQQGDQDIDVECEVAPEKWSS